MQNRRRLRGQVSWMGRGRGKRHVCPLLAGILSVFVCLILMANTVLAIQGNPYECQDGTALAVDGRGRVWVAFAGKPDIAALDPSSGQAHAFQYAAPSIAAHPPLRRPGSPPSTLPTFAPNAVWLTHMAVMATDGQGHLYYIRAGSDAIEEVAA